jgi:hypothetical protein
MPATSSRPARSRRSASSARGKASPGWSASPNAALELAENNLELAQSHLHLARSLYPGSPRLPPLFEALRRAELERARARFAGVKILLWNRVGSGDAVVDRACHSVVFGVSNVSPIVFSGLDPSDAGAAGWR